MKQKQQKYVEAVQRNLDHAKGHGKFRGLSSTDAKVKLGIRKDDTSFDRLVEVIING